MKKNGSTLVVSVGSAFVLLFLTGKFTSNIQAQPVAVQARPDLVRDAVESRSPAIALERVPLESPAGLGFYATRIVTPRPGALEGLLREQNVPVKIQQVNHFARYLGPAMNEMGVPFTRMLVDQERGHMLLLPDLEALAKAGPKLLNQEGAFASARDFVMKQELVPRDDSEFMPQKMIIRSKTTVTSDGKATTVDVLQTVAFERILDKMPMLGRGSQLTVDLANNGQVVGLNRTWNQVVKTTLKPDFFSDAEIYDAVERLVKQRISGPTQVTVKKPRLIYYQNQEGKYVFPAYFFTAVLSSQDVAQKSYFAGVVPAAKNSPETVALYQNSPERPAGIKLAPKNPTMLRATPVPPNDPTVGRYVVRNDSSDWVDDANEFKSGLIAGHSGGLPAITFGDYFWDEPFCWTTSANSFVNKWNITLMEGHGNTWLFTTSKNCCDIVNLNDGAQPGYGNLAGSSMRFLILKGCAIIPAPPDRSDWATPWWKIFNGLHQAIGFRTEMYIDDDIAEQFGSFLGQNCQALDSFFCATDNCSSYQWERFWGSWGDQIYGYGSVVMIPGHEGEGIYSTAPAPSASSAGLTIWWQH